MTLAKYVQKIATRGECRCGQCMDVGDAPDPIGHTVDMHFFTVGSIGTGNANTLRKLIAEHKGHYGDVDPLDGKEHGYMELGGWIGDQGLALMLMGLGTILGLWEALTPRGILGADMPDDLLNTMAGQGMVSIIAKGQ